MTFGSSSSSHHHHHHHHNSASTEAALRHLRRIRPLDGWSAQHKDKEHNSSCVRLCRRAVPLTDNYFLDLHYDEGASDCVVGILTRPSRDNGGRAQAQMLTDAAGKPVGRKLSLVQVTTWDPNHAKTKAPTTTSSKTPLKRPTSTNNYPAARGGGGATTTTTTTTTLSDDQNKELLTYAAYGVGALIAFRVLFSAFIGLYVLAFPVMILYMIQTCPSAESFEPKKELKRVLRGQHLPEDHPDKPKGFWHETFRRAQASVLTEIATGFGYEVTMYPLYGAAHFCSVKVPSANLECYWIGALGKWTHVYHRQLRDDNNNNNDPNKRD